MIKTWTLQNFKSVCAKTTLEMAPLTIFTGANSSGKSTLIQSILLTAQTLQSSVLSRSVVLNGHIVRLGAYNDIVSNGYQDSAILIGFELSPISEQYENSLSYNLRRYQQTLFPHIEKTSHAIKCYFAFSTKAGDEEKEILQLQPHLDETYLKATSLFDESKNEEEILIRRSAKELQQRVMELSLHQRNMSKPETLSLQYDVVNLSSGIKKRIRRSRRFYGTGKPVGASFTHFLPFKISTCFDEVDARSRRLLDILIEHSYHYSREIDFDSDKTIASNVNFRNIILGILNEVSKEPDMSNVKLKKLAAAIQKLEENFSVHILIEVFNNLSLSTQRTLIQRFIEKSDEILRVIKADKQPEYTIEYMPLPDLLESAVEYVSEYFSRSVKYLGPLRDEPKPVYPLSGATDPRDIGFKGEHTAAVLELHRNTKVEYIPSGKLVTSPKASTVIEAPLLIAVLDWLEYMGIAKNVQTFDLGKLGHELKIATTTSNYLHDLTHVGVGVSQVLPILVLSLLAKKGATLIFEQPELHLHPRVQTRLADFFVSMMMIQKQCIVETHSEYLINRLRYQSAISDDELISNNVMMYFVEKHQEYSAYRPIKINRYGVIEDWPRGFFDENEENAASVLKAAMDKRKREGRRND